MREGVLERMLHVGVCPVRIRSWHVRGGIRIRAEAMEPRLAIHYDEALECGEAGEAELELAIDRMRFALGLDDDMGDFFRAFKQDPLIGPTIHHRPWVRPRRRPWPWEALVWAITEQLIQLSRAAAIQRRMVRRWAPSYSHDEPVRRRWRPWPLRDVPSAELIAGRAPAELASMDLSPGRSVAMVHCAREVARQRVDLSDPDGDRRLLEIPEIGPWTMQCLGYHGRG